MAILFLCVSVSLFSLSIYIYTVFVPGNLAISISSDCDRQQTAYQLTIVGGICFVQLLVTLHIKEMSVESVKVLAQIDDHCELWVVVK